MTERLDIIDGTWRQYGEVKGFTVQLAPGMLQCKLQVTSALSYPALCLVSNFFVGYADLSILTLRQLE